MRTHHCLGCSGSKRFAAPSLRSGASMRSSFAGSRRARLAATYPSRIRHKVEALNPDLWKLGTQQGLGSQWCNRLPSIPQEVGGERGCGRYVLSASYLTDPPLKSSTYLRTRGRVDNEANELTGGSRGDCPPSTSCGGGAGHPA